MKTSPLPTRTGDAREFLRPVAHRPDTQTHVRRVFLRAIALAGTHPQSIVTMASFLNKCSLTAEDRRIWREGGTCTPGLWLWAALSSSRADARAYAAELAAECPKGVR